MNMRAGKPNSRAAPATDSEASKMLEAALQQMDGIISGSTAATMNISHHLHSSGTSGGGISAASTQLPSELNMISAANVLSTAKTLALALQQVGCNAPSPDPITSAVIIDWLETHLPRQDTDERLRRLQRDKESIAVQYQALADRVSEQSDKIIELEKHLTEKTQQLNAAEDMLQRQVFSRSALETQKLELMSALSELKLHRAALERENVELKSNSNSTTSSSSNGTNGSVAMTKRLPFGSVGNLHQIGVSSNSSSNGTPKTPPSSLRHQVHPQFHSLPRSHTASTNKNNNGRYQGVPASGGDIDNNANCNNQQQKQRNVNFAEAEKVLIDDMYGSFISQINSTPSPNLKEKFAAKGLRNIFGKLRRSNSGNLEIPSLEEHEFKRGGARATAGGRIEWTTQLMSSSKPYQKWSTNDVCHWLCDMGLGCYEDDCRKWLKNNPAVCFFDVSPIDIDKELNLKMPLHRKKIMLAMAEITGKDGNELALKAGQLDVSWVMRWLDDIGLPQYKDTFLIAKVDGRMLHRLTLEDLTQVHVSSCLHIASLRRGIQCMREMHWNSECLIRRSTKNSAANDDAEDEEEETIAEDVSLWTAHRVMEWLRVADLSEYAPNLRGAGVHGALMLFEPKFTADLLADLLSIPPSKTLLRRHLATHFKELLGRDIIQTKRDAESVPGYQPLTITAKIKPQKKSQFSLKRRKSTKGSEIEWTDYVCPMTTTSGESESQNNISSSSSTNNSSSIHSN